MVTNRGSSLRRYSDLPLMCLDDRVLSQPKSTTGNNADEPVITAPGGDLGEFILAMDTYFDAMQFFAYKKEMNNE